MGFAFSELGHDVAVWDAKSANIDDFMKQVHSSKGSKGNIAGFYDISNFAASVGDRGRRKVFMIPITHGDPTDQVLSKTRPVLNSGEMILDGGNEHYRKTERGKKNAETWAWIGSG